MIVRCGGVLALVLVGCGPGTGRDDTAVAPTPDDTAPPDDSPPPDDSVPQDDSVPPDDSTVIVPGDDDGDGWSEEMGDCDDADADVYPSAHEISGDGRDQNCDGSEVADSLAIDEAGLRLFEENAAFWRFAGAAVAFLPDLSGDGLDDVIIGAPVVQEEKWGGGGRGHAYLLDGPFASTLLPEDAFAQIWADGPLDGGGQVVASLGDLDGDSYPEIAFGSPLGLLNPSGYLAVFSTPFGAASIEVAEADTVLVGLHNGALGDSVAPLGEGRWAFTLGSPADLIVAIHTGMPVSADPLDGAEAVLSGVEDHGDTALGHGDFNGDGVNDLVVGAGSYEATSDSEPGTAYLLPGPLNGSLLLEDIGANWRGTWENEHAGEALAAPGDLDDDGLDDVVVGGFDRPKVGPIAGGAFVVLGSATLDGEHILDDEAYLRIESENDLDSLGDDVVGAGDIDGDGLPDVAISASRSFSDDAPPPRIYLMRSPLPSGVVTAGDLDAVLVGTANDVAAGIPYFSGQMLAGDGDTDGDGIPELLIGCPRLTGDLLYAGGAYLVEGFGSPEP